MTGNKLYLDYIAGADPAAGFYTHPPLDFDAAQRARAAYSYPRREVGRLLHDYNAALGAHAGALANIDALADAGAFCVIAGNQVGFLGGPVYTTYKIVTTIRLAERLEAELGVRVVPTFWLASEDHDFNEINHIHFLKGDGETGRVKFGWEQEGRPVSDLPITDEVRRAYQEYLACLPTGPHRAEVEELFAPDEAEDYCSWQARIWARLFSGRGLVLVEPRVIRPAGGSFFRLALEHAGEIEQRLAGVARRLAEAGYAPQLTSEEAGRLYTFAADGRRVRVEHPQEHVPLAEAHPERYSSDAALRPLFADSLLPVLADVSGPGEISYQAMLRPLHDLFEVPQPLLFPRMHCTVVSASEASLLARYGTSAEEVLLERLDPDAAFRRLAPEGDLALFVAARGQVESALAPLRPYLEGIDPGLGQTWARALEHSLGSIDKLEERALKARMSQLRFSKQELLSLRNSLLPRGRLQERVLPLPHFLNRHGTAFLDELFSAGNLDHFTHRILTLENTDA